MIPSSNREARLRPALVLRVNERVLDQLETKDSHVEGKRLIVFANDKRDQPDCLFHMSAW